MQMFSYKATNGTGKVISGSLEAVDIRDAVARLQDMGYIPIKVLPSGGSGWLNMNLSRHLSLFQRVSTKDVAIFTQDLSSLLGAGLPIDRALVLLLDVTENDKFRAIIDDILKTVRGGGYLSDALTKHPHVFSTFYVNMVRAGEAGSVLDSVLDRLSIFWKTPRISGITSGLPWCIPVSCFRGGYFNYYPADLCHPQVFVDICGYGTGRAGHGTVFARPQRCVETLLGGDTRCFGGERLPGHTVFPYTCRAVEAGSVQDQTAGEW